MVSTIKKISIYIYIYEVFGTFKKLFELKHFLLSINNHEKCNRH